ncbi:MAG TPA: hypothetical protein VFQ77_19640 [Pseudonocardiaceae bacterium]|jgi:hypothetical protein|nr:hypothetical protein [Pseudonocardiaceae bacterium]
MSQLMMPPAVADKFLVYTTKTHEDVAAASTLSSPVSGIVICDRAPRVAVQRVRLAGYRSVVIPEVGAWTRAVATADSPTVLQDPDALSQISLDSWASNLLRAGADAVFTPSKFVGMGDWDALRAVLRAGEETKLPEVVTLVATDAAMLDSRYLQTFVDVVVTDRPVAFVFAAGRAPFRPRGRVAGLRCLMSRLPGCFLLATEPLVATDGYAHGASGAAIGIGGGARQPKRPQDTSRPNAKGFLPGLFLRDLWEHRTPDVYADWFANSPSPTCRACNGRALDVFDHTDADKRIILSHNVHTWLAVFDELRARARTEQRRWSAGEWASALAAHLTLRPAAGTLEADIVLRQLVELDDPLGRRTTSQGALR